MEADTVLGIMVAVHRCGSLCSSVAIGPIEVLGINAIVATGAQKGSAGAFAMLYGVMLRVHSTGSYASHFSESSIPCLAPRNHDITSFRGFEHIPRDIELRYLQNTEPPLGLSVGR